MRWEDRDKIERLLPRPVISEDTAALWDTMRGFLIACAFRAGCQNQEDAEDIAQECVFVMSNNVHVPQAGIHAFMRHVVINMVHERTRRHYQRSTTETEFATDTIVRHAQRRRIIQDDDGAWHDS